MGESVRNNSSSVRRALRITGALAEATGDGVSLAELSTRLDLNKGTVLRLIRPLLDARMVARTAAGRYRLGVQTLVLGGAFLASLDIRQVARGELEVLMSATGETVHLVVYDRPDVVYVDKVDSPSTVRMVSRIGSRMPAYSTAVGKTFLAHATAEEVAAALAHGMPRRTGRTITSRRAMATELKRVRRAGYAVDNQENEDDIVCVAAPVRDHTGAVVSAVSVSGPATRMTAAKRRRAVPLVVAAAERVSGHLGWSPEVTSRRAARPRARSPRRATAGR